MVDSDGTAPIAATPTEGLLLQILDKLHSVEMAITHESEMGKRRDGHIRELGRGVKALTGRLDRQDLNGAALKLRELGRHAEPLLRLAEAAPAVLESLPTPGEMEYRRALVANLPVMERFVALAPKLIETMDERAERAIFWKQFRQFIRPWKALGAAVWLILLAAVSGAGVGLFHIITGH